MSTFMGQIDWARGLQIVGTLLGMTALLSWLQPLILPVVLATLLTFVLSPAVSAVERRLRSRPLAVGAVAGGALAAMGLLIWALMIQTAAVLESLPSYETTLRRKVASLQAGDGLLDRVNRLAQRLQSDLREDRTPKGAMREAMPPAQPVRIVPEPVTLAPRDVVIGLLPALKPLGEVLLACVLVLFFLLRREDLRDRVMSVIGSRHLAASTRALDDAAARISAYLLRQLAVNAGFGGVVGSGLFLLGMPHAAVLGVVAGVLRYLPYIGPWVAALLPLALSLAVFDGWLHFGLVLAFLLTAELLTNLVVEPWLYGQGLGVSDVATVVMVAFWTWLWGPLGLLVGTPLTVCLFVLGRFVPGMHVLETLLGDRPALPSYLSFYQRVLAGRLDEALDLLGTDGGEAAQQFMDHLVLPAMARAAEDARDGSLSVSEWLEFQQSTARIVLEALGTGGTSTESNPQDIAPGAPVLAVAFDDTNARVLAMQAPFWQWAGLPIRTLPPQGLVAQWLDAIIEEQPATILVSALAPASLAFVRLLLRRLSARAPGMRVVVGCWAASGDEGDLRRQLLGDGATAVVTTMHDALRALQSGPRPPMRPSAGLS